MLKKPANATWVGKVVVDGLNSTAEFGPSDLKMAAHDLPKFEMVWYGDDRVKLTFRDGCPAVIRQAYLTGDGQDLIIDLKKD
jgi:hypothetical protein